MISKEQFEKIESQYGCGYWNLCYDRGCPCAIITEDKGFQEDIYNEFAEDHRKMNEQEKEKGNEMWEPLDY